MKIIWLILLFLYVHLVIGSPICTCRNNEKCCVYYTENPFGIHTKCCPGSSNCCGSKCCDSNTHICCGNKCYEKNSYTCCGLNACHHNTTCCRGISTVCCDTLTQICCDGKCYDKNNYTCCETNSVCPINLECTGNTYWNKEHMRDIQKCCQKYHTKCPSDTLASFYDNCCPTFYPILWVPITILILSTIIVFAYYCFCYKNNNQIIVNDEVHYQTLYGSFSIMKKIKVDNDYATFLKPYSYTNVNALKIAIIGIANGKFKTSSYLQLQLVVCLFSLGIIFEYHYVVILFLTILLCFRILQFLLCWLRIGWLRCNYLHYACIVVTILVWVASIGTLFFFDFSPPVQVFFPGIVFFAFLIALYSPLISMEEQYNEIIITTGSFMAILRPYGYYEITKNEIAEIKIEDYQKN